MYIRYTDILETFITSAVVSFLLTPVVRGLAEKNGYLDHPRDNKRHARSTPLLGGVAIFLAFIIGVLSQWDSIVFAKNFQIQALLAGCVILFVIGLIDDRVGMDPNTKLFGQFLAAMVAYKSGLKITFLGNYYVNLIVSYLWFIGITNAFNLLDNMNGLSSGVAAICAFFFGIIGWMNGQYIVSIISFCLVGSCIGFLRYNFPRASIFMGDSGSIVLGFVLSGIEIMGHWRTFELLTSVAVPLLVLAYPIFDTTLVTVVRLMEKRSVFSGGKDHSSHRLALLGLKSKRAVLIAYLICISTGLAALIVSRVSFTCGLYIIGAVVTALFILGVRLASVNTGRFGRKKGMSPGED